ncbi:leucyl aminopeptidase [Enterobacteriaceae endosymbiont of Plateumaris consimilis]|uniref:leucyl aminopeptidase n=1 Tax=Enterobacteriaceae endosymbiont of Plateumaris consimilis TaxID=2675794 RepID=UPI001448D4A4|nr:leucyl aminopeptidase [Enterobacteriaceae endosymbiont of Plateumaris consimilis]QJC28562.1 leucyl aminopeptidase [Enterobacteriaceae endosymbiont of Plateumaris consimilis]
MKYLVEKTNFSKKYKSDCMVIGIFEKYQLSYIADILNTISNNYILNILKNNDFKGKINQIIMLYEVPNILIKKILIIGCGIKEKFNREKNKIIIKKVIHQLKTIKIKDIFWCLTDLIIKNIDLYWNIRDTISIIEENIYIFNKFKKIKKYTLSLIKFNINNNNIQIYKKAITHSIAINIGITQTKNIANLPPNICNPEYLSLKTYKLANKYTKNISVEIIDEEKMKHLGMNAYLAVGNGSKNKSVMSIIKYDNLFDHSKPIVLIGKGLTFDSGGISLKPSFHMDEMKYDMCGAACIYGVMNIISELKLPLKVIGIIAGCENMPDSNAFRPSDIIQTMSGKTVEIINTDAEGRLVLCDVLTYINRFNPSIVIDIATLTGACVIALGNNISGFMSNDLELSKNIIKASLDVDDRVWELPMDDKSYYNQLKSDIADIRNTSNSNSGGAITAACFLSKFTKKYKWAHIDIAGTAWNYNENNKAFASGRPVNMLCQFLLNYSNHNN